MELRKRDIKWAPGGWRSYTAVNGHRLLIQCIKN